MDDDRVYMTEYQYRNCRDVFLVLIWVSVPFWAFVGLACLSVLALAGWA